MRVFKTGERVTFTLEGRSVQAVVVLASENGRALAVEFEAIMSGWVGAAPILWNDQRQRFEDLHGRIVGIK